MRARLLLERLVRLSIVVFLLLTSIYCLIAYVPFTYEQVIKFRLISWVTAFAEVHAYAYATAAIALTWTLREALSRPQARWLAGAFVVATIGLAAFFLFHPAI